MKFRSILSLMLMITCVSVFSQQKSVDFPLARLEALGGTHAALTNDFSTLFTNPSGFVSVKEQLNVISIGAKLSGPITTIANMALSSGGDLLSSLPLLFDENGRLYTQLDLGGPLAFGYVGGGIGFALMNRSWVEVNAPSLMNVNLNLKEELYLTGGYAFRVPIPNNMKIDFGVLPKGFIRGSFPINTDILGATALASKLPSILSTEKFYMTSGIGLDLGMKFSYDQWVSVALVAHDAYTPTFTTQYTSFDGFVSNPVGSKIGESEFGLVPCKLDFGISGNPPLFFMEGLLNSVTFYADYLDLLDLFRVYPRNAILNVSLASEVVLLDIFSLRAGIRDALPSVGFGLDLTWFTIDFAMFGREFGKDPGERPVFSMLMNVEVKL